MRRHLSPVLLFIAVAFMFGGARDSFARNAYATAAPGRIVITCSPVLPTFIGIPILIDGRQAGVLTKGHQFRQYLPPGRHVITVSRNGRRRETTHTVVHVRPWQTYHFVAKYNVNQVILVRPNEWSGRY
jgi:hypothetical protein